MRWWCVSERGMPLPMRSSAFAVLLTLGLGPIAACGETTTVPEPSAVDDTDGDGTSVGVGQPSGNDDYASGDPCGVGVPCAAGEACVDGTCNAAPVGETWTPVDAKASWLRDITFANGRFVGVGANVVTTEDGTTWPPHEVPAPLESIAAHDGLFVAAGQGTILTSTDGASWTPQKPPAGNPEVTFRGLAWGLGMFLGADRSGDCFASPDGALWTPSMVRSRPSPTAMVSSSRWAIAA